MSDNDISLKEYMKERFEDLDKKLDNQYKDISDKLDPVVEWKAEAQGSIKSLKWVIGIGMSMIGIALTVIGLYLSFLRMKP